MIVATYASLRTARVTLGDAEMRSKYDEQERVKAREYAEDVDDDNTYLGAAKRKVFGVIYYGIYGGIVAWTVVAVVACLAYVACTALASIPNAPPLFGRCADRCGSVILWLNPGWSTVCTLAFCAPSTVLAAMLSAFAVFLFLFSLLATVWKSNLSYVISTPSSLEKTPLLGRRRVDGHRARKSTARARWRGDRRRVPACEPVPRHVQVEDRWPSIQIQGWP